MKCIHLICNAHLDPYWQWEWEEGAAAAISTFRAAADFCEEFDGFVFNHNEVILYRWVEEYEPALFARIQRLVTAGKWHIMGGWYLQPDCNMPSGESFVRQILLGKSYFRERFNVEPTTAINFDPFGHSRGLVQILAKSGYDSYLFCRPNQEGFEMENDDFTWVGYDGSEVLAHRAKSFYNNSLGKAREKVENWLKTYPEREVGIVLWGVGNHGGGPSRQDLRMLAELMDESDFEIAHSTPEAYFADVRKHGVPVPRRAADINPWGIGCYTSMIRIKQKHRLLENELYMTEKMCASAAVQQLMAYPREEFIEVMRDLATGEFHDILPGSSIQPVEDAGLRLFDHALEILSRIKARAFFCLCAGQPVAPDGQIPILIYNPHPYPVRGVFECEFQTADAAWNEQFTVATATQHGTQLPTQVEKEHSNLSLDWRKRVVFEAELAPSQVNRFDCTLEVLPERPKPQLAEANGHIAFQGQRVKAVVNCKTGFVDALCVDGRDILKPGSFEPVVMKDNEDPWSMLVEDFREEAGAFELMSAEEGTRFSGVTRGTIPSVRVIEEGAVRTVVESILRYGDSFLLLTYRFPKTGTEIELDVRVHWNEKDKMLKLRVPTRFEKARLLGQQAFGLEEMPATGREAVAQKWLAVVDDAAGAAFTCINDGVYGLDYRNGELRVSLLRSPAYCAHPIFDRPFVMQDRYSPRLDQGERLYRFWFNAGAVDERLARVDREALAHNEKPFALSFFPSGAGEAPLPGLILDDEAVQMSAFKMAHTGDDFIVRVFEPTGRPRQTMLRIPALGLEHEIALTPFEVATYLVDVKMNRLAPVDLLERESKA